MTRAGLAIALSAVAACGDDAVIDRCALGTSTAAVSAPARKLYGPAAPYDGDGTLRGLDDALAGSQRQRRAVAWAAVARALQPVALAVAPARSDATVPAWLTWYGKDDLQRLFHRLYPALSADRKRARDPFAPTEIDLALAWNPTAVDGLDGWTPERWAAYLAALDSVIAVNGAAGTNRVGYSPGAARHLLASYPQIVACAQDPARPARIEDGPGAGQRQLVRVPLGLDACGEASFGPYFVDADGALTAAAPGAAITITDDAGAVRCAGAVDEPCTAPGPGPLRVTAVAGGAPVASALEIDYAAADPTWAACLAAPFPLDAAVIKADWRRLQGEPLPTYDTSAAALTRHLGAGGDLDWGPGDGAADPGADRIFTIATEPTTVGGPVYRLAALHLMTKELDHWLWITLWWSPDPDRDFGADRPPAIAALGGPWRNYKMCVTTAFDERDPDPQGGFAAIAPDLCAALAATRAAPGAPSWCSNPYLELGHGNAASNCMGCHQHGGTAVGVDQILGDPDGFPSLGRTQVRDNFPSDYSWALDAGDRLGRVFADEVEYWDQGL
ncbi:MAG: hypothetical protein K8W52_43880 [Deltaproteobacteria bacterium]|nr:hypothetical protein [Deltaproteobacteria bacterium]